VGGFCPCVASGGPGTQGGNGGAGGNVLASAGAGGDGIGNNEGSNGGDATSLDGGAGGDSGSGSPAGVAGNGGLSSATAGTGGSNGGGNGSATAGVGGNAVAPAADVTCPPGLHGTVVVAFSSINALPSQAIFEVVSVLNHSDLACCAYSVAPDSTATDRATQIVDECLASAGNGVTASRNGSTMAIDSGEPAELRVCAVSNSTTCPVLGSACSPAALIGTQTVYGQRYSSMVLAPTLNIWGLTTLALLLALAGGVLLHRRRALHMTDQ
jgi:hypothetical protein